MNDIVITVNTEIENCINEVLQKIIELGAYSVTCTLSIGMICCSIDDYGIIETIRLIPNVITVS